MTPARLPRVPLVEHTRKKRRSAAAAACLARDALAAADAAGGVVGLVGLDHVAVGVHGDPEAAVRAEAPGRDRERQVHRLARRQRGGRQRGRPTPRRSRRAWSMGRRSQSLDSARSRSARHLPGGKTTRWRREPGSGPEARAARASHARGSARRRCRAARSPAPARRTRRWCRRP